MTTILPIDAALPGILESLRESRALIVSASPGAGKTTRLPPACLELTEKKVWVLEPRRIAAVGAAARIAEEKGWTLGQEVGYQVRFDNKSSKDTRLLFLTEALLMRKMLQDPELKDVGVVILDEFHERSLHVDLAIGALKELQELSRPDLKIVVMSATLNAGPLSRFLGDAPTVEVPGRLFPMDVIHDDKPLLPRTGPDFTERMKRLVMRAVTENDEGDLLCFLPGQGEIERLREALTDFAAGRGLALRVLHGRLGLDEQQAAIRPAPRGGRKIVLSTNVAESSLTVEGVRLVVDSGLARLSQIHPRTGYASLDLVRISKASATQRAGRSARLAPGVVYRAWTPHDELSMKDFEPAEIHRSDLSETLLLLASLGIRQVQSFSWFEAPAGRAVESARNFLILLGALENDGRPTALGSRLRDFPLHPRLAKLLIRGTERGHAREAAEIAALLAEPGRAPGAKSEAENDLVLAWEAWKRDPRHPRAFQLNRAAEQLLRLTGSENVAVQKKSSPSGKPAPSGESVRSEKFGSSPGGDSWLPDLLLETFGDRLCRRRRAREPQARMVGGRGVKLHPDSSVKSSEYFVALDLAEGRDAAETLVYQAAGIPTSLIESRLLPEARRVERLEWEEDRKRFVAVETREWNGLPLAGENRRPALPEEVASRMVDVARSQWERGLAANEDLAQWLLRVKMLSRSRPEWPELSEEQRNQGLELACFGETSIDGVFGKNLVPFFEGLLEPGHREALNRECPLFWTVPTGNRLRIRYSEEQGPSVEVRLQELFGLVEAPKVAGQSLTLFLLAPNYRPVQVTRDLASFWKNGYPEVRKELRTRYPKHSWPEDPLTAPPQAKGRPTRS